LSTTKTHKNYFLIDQENARLVLGGSHEKEEVVKSVKSQRERGNEYKLHVVMDTESFNTLRRLKTQLEALSEAEVVRRALKAYELFAPDDESAMHSAVVSNDHQRNDLIGNNVEHLYVRIPHRMKERLDIEQKASGRNYGEQVRQALRVLTQLVMQVEAYKTKSADTPKGGHKGRRPQDDLLELKLASVC